MSDVVKFPSKVSEIPEQTLLVEPHFRYCQHKKIQLDQGERILRCKDCNGVLNAFDYLVDNAMHLRRAWIDHANVTNQLRDLQSRVDALKAEEKRLKGRVRTAREKTVKTAEIRSRGDDR